MVAEILAAGALACKMSEQRTDAERGAARLGRRTCFLGRRHSGFFPKRPPGIVNQLLERVQQPGRVVFVRMFNVWGHITSVTRSEATAAIV